MEFVEISRIQVRKRQRKTIAGGPLNDLKSSITNVGLLHSPVGWYDNGVPVLTIGERRLRAVDALHKDKQLILFRGSPIPQGTIPFEDLGTYLDEVGRFEAELDENVRRADLDWPDRVQAMADLHEMRLKQNPKQTFMQTGQELVDRGMTSEQGPLTNPVRASVIVNNAVLIAKHLDNEKVANARNPAEAVALIYKMEEEKITAALIRRQILNIPSKPSIEIRHGDSLTILPNVDSGLADLIIADPPYGIGAESSGFRSRTVHHHNYADTVEVARELAQAIMVEGFRICKPRANLFMFCDIDLFPWLKSTAANMGWSVFRRPLIWQKSQSEGLAPWGQAGPRITTEFILFATKGQRGLNASPIDVFTESRVSRQERVHAAEKPVDLLKRLIQCSTLPGDYVLDPCCGSGSTLVAAKELKRTGLGIEKDPDYFNTAMTNVHGGQDAATESHLD